MKGNDLKQGNELSTKQMNLITRFCYETLNLLGIIDKKLRCHNENFKIVDLLLKSG